MPNTPANPLLNEVWADVLEGTLAGLLSASGGVVVAAAAGTDYLAPSGSGAALSGVVHTTGTETIAGSKTHTATTTFKAASGSHYEARDSSNNLLAGLNSDGAHVRYMAHAASRQMLAGVPADPQTTVTFNHCITEGTDGTLDGGPADVVYSWGWNDNGNGSKLDQNQVSFCDSMEYYFTAGGDGTQFNSERHIAEHYLVDGTGIRPITMTVNHTTGAVGQLSETNYYQWATPIDLTVYMEIVPSGLGVGTQAFGPRVGVQAHAGQVGVYIKSSTDTDGFKVMDSTGAATFLRVGVDGVTQLGAAMINTTQRFDSLQIGDTAGIFSAASTSSGSPIGGVLSLGDSNFFSSGYHNKGPAVAAVYSSTLSVGGNLGFYVYDGTGRVQAGYFNHSRDLILNHNLGFGVTTASNKIHIKGVPTDSVSSNASITLETAGDHANGYAYAGFELLNESGLIGGLSATGRSYPTSEVFKANAVVIQALTPAGGTHGDLAIVARGGDAGTNVAGTSGDIILQAGGYQVACEKMRIGPAGISWFGATKQAKPTITGSRGANAALTSLLTALAAYGLVIDNTTT